MKNYIQILILIFIAAAINFSCEKDITVDTGNPATQYVVEGWIFNNEQPVILLSKTLSPYGQTLDFVDLIDSTYLRDAAVTVSQNGGNAVNLVQTSPAQLSNANLMQLAMMFGIPVEFVSYFPLPIYTDTTGTIVGLTNNHYQLNINYNGHLLSAETTIPTQYPLDSLSYTPKEAGSNLYTIYLNLSLPTIPGNYVQYATKRNSEIFYFPSQSGATWSDDIFQGASSVSLPAERGYPDSLDIDINDFGYFEYGDTVTVQWRNIDKQSYDFWYSIENDGGDTPFSSPIKAATNVNGGLGIFAGYNISYITTIIE